MKNQKTVNGQVKCLLNLRVTGAAMLLAAVAATPAHAASASKSECVGDWRFLGCASYTFSDRVDRDKYTASLSAQADGVVLYKACRLGSATTTLEVQKGKRSRLYGNIKLAGVSVSTWDKSWDGSVEYRTPTLVGSEVAGEVSFGIGPVDFDVRGKAVAGIYVQASIQVAVPPGGRQPVLKGSIGPVLDASVTGKADLDFGIGSIGIEADFTLVRAGLTGQITYTPKSAGHATVAYGVTADFHEPDGKIRAFGTVDLGWLGSHTINKTLYEYNGDAHSWPLASGVLNL